MQRNLETQTRPEVTPFINTQTAAGITHLLFVRRCVRKKRERERRREGGKKEKACGVYRGYLATSVCLLPTEGGSLTGYEISDMPHPPSLSQSPSFA